MKPHKQCIPIRCDCVKDYIEEHERLIKPVKVKPAKVKTKRKTKCELLGCNRVAKVMIGCVLMCLPCSKNP